MLKNILKLKDLKNYQKTHKKKS